MREQDNQAHKATRTLKATLRKSSQPSRRTVERLLPAPKIQLQTQTSIPPFTKSTSTTACEGLTALVYGLKAPLRRIFTSSASTGPHSPRIGKNQQGAIGALRGSQTILINLEIAPWGWPLPRFTTSRQTVLCFLGTENASAQPIPKWRRASAHSSANMRPINTLPDRRNK